MCANLKDMDLENCAHKQTISSSLLYSFTHEARGSLNALDQIFSDFSCVAYDRSGVHRITQIRYPPVSLPEEWGGHSHTTGLKDFSLGGLNACREGGLELLCEQPRHYSAEPDKKSYLGQGQQHNMIRRDRSILWGFLGTEHGVELS